MGGLDCVQHPAVSPVLPTWQNDFLLLTNKTGLLHSISVPGLKEKADFNLFARTDLVTGLEWKRREKEPFPPPNLSQDRAFGHKLLSCSHYKEMLEFESRLGACLHRLHIQSLYILKGDRKICLWIKRAAVEQLRPNANNNNKKIHPWAGPIRPKACLWDITHTKFPLLLQIVTAIVNAVSNWVPV